MDRPSSRYKKLVEELGREMNCRYGWQSEVARKLGMQYCQSAELRSRSLSSAQTPAERWTVWATSRAADWTRELALAIEIVVGEARRCRVSIDTARRGLLAQMRRQARSSARTTAVSSVAA